MAIALVRKSWGIISPFCRDFLTLFYPERCRVCEQPLLETEKCLCLSCQLDLPETNYEKDPNNPVAQRFWGRIKLSHASSYLYFQKGGAVQMLIHELKYRNNLQVGFFLGLRYGNKLKKNSSLYNIDGIFPVPLFPGKLKERGYNQSEIIAKGIAKAFGLPPRLNILVKSKKTATQTRKGRFLRWKNMEEVFEVLGKLDDFNHILLVDDVVTTGSTLEACANALVKIKPDLEISVVTLACS